MSAESKLRYGAVCSSLNAQLRDCEAKIRVSKSNLRLIESNKSKLKMYEDSIQVCDVLINTFAPLIKDITAYIANKREESLNNVNNAIRLANEIIVDAMEGIHFEIDGDEAWLATADGLDVARTEGGGYRTIVSAFLRAVVLSANSESYLQTLFLDEVFALVNSENSAVLSTYLNIMCKTLQVISIEQKPEVYSNISTVEYMFEKDDVYSRVTRKDIDRT